MQTSQIIKRPLHTEKSVDDIRSNNQYHFEVDNRAGKYDVKLAVEEMFPGVKVRSVNVLWVKSKPRKAPASRVIGRTSEWKKAIVKLRPGDTIDIGF